MSEKPENDCNHDELVPVIGSTHGAMYCKNCGKLFQPDL